MSTITEDRTESASSHDVFEKGAICKLENENIEHCVGEDGSEANSVQPNYMKTITTLTLNANVRGPKFYCCDCNYYLHTHLSMNTHMKMHRQPFCPICFQTFSEESDAIAHTANFHGFFFPNAMPVPPVEQQMQIVEENPFDQTEAPPNSPTHEYTVDLGGRSSSELEYGFVNSSNNNNNSIPFLLAEKLREHQTTTNHGLRTRNQLYPSHLPGNSGQLGAGEAVNTANRRSATSHRRSSIVGVLEKVHKPSSKPKSTPKAGSSSRVNSEEPEDNVLKRITSRFGRSISLKVPQF
uniref:C2H2-type domain-containing protein n=1 Tax=Anopheles epiroticus TaxID=199890 RepID=A0A182PXI0_9DIPT